MMVDKETLLKATLNTKEVNVFSGTVKVRELTIKEAMIVADMETNKAMIQAVSFALVEPSFTVEELNTFPASYVNDFATIVEAISNDSE